MVFMAEIVYTNTQIQYASQIYTQNTEAPGSCRKIVISEVTIIASLGYKVSGSVAMAGS